MRDVAKAQLAIGLLAFFATVWKRIIELILNQETPDFIYAAGVIILQLVVILILSYVIIAILEWIRIYDIKANSIITLLTLVTLLSVL